MAGGQPPLPRPASLGDPKARAICLARFAHHELMAVELFAWALLRWPDMPSAMRSDFLQALTDEQRHCRMYLDRLEAMGSSFSDFTHSNYFWRHAPAIALSPHGPRSFLAAMGLTLEQANLDFTLIYRDGFRAAGDEESAKVIQRVHDDEIAHVAMSARWLRALGPPGADTIEAYREAVPFPLSAARAKARRFDVTSRRRAGLEESFISYVRASRSSQETQRTRRKKKTPAATGPSLYANLGAEELPGKDGIVISESTAATLRLWRLLFSDTARFVSPIDREDANDLVARLNQSWWPQGLGAPARTAVFPWLEKVAGTVPWISTSRLEIQPRFDRHPIEAAPPGVVARVHDKAFAVRVAGERGLVPDELAESFLILSPEDLAHPDEAIRRMEETMSRWPDWVGRNFTLKPRLGTSGRGRVPGVNGKPDSPAVRGALRRLARRGGAILEPWFDRSIDLSTQLHVLPNEGITLLGTLEQIVARSGVYLGHRAEFDSRGRVFSGTPYEEALRESSALVAGEAQKLGFHGPCGVDAFALTPRDGEEIGLLRPVVELNARYTMGTIVIGLLRRALESVREPLGLSPGSRRAFLFGLDAPQGGWEEARASAGDDAILLMLGHPEDEVQPAFVFAETREQLDAAVEATRQVRKRS